VSELRRQEVSIDKIVCTNWESKDISKILLLLKTNKGRDWD